MNYDDNTNEDLAIESVNEPLRQQIRAMVANIDGLQKERVAQGNISHSIREHRYKMYHIQLEYS